MADKTEIEKQIEDITLAIEKDPRNAQLYYDRGKLYGENEQLDKAIDDFSKTINLDPIDKNAFFNRGLLYKEKEEFDKSILDLTVVIRLDPENKDAYLSRGFLYGIKEEFDRSILDFTTVIKSDPKNQDAYFSRGLLYIEKKEFDKSISDFTTAINLDSEYKKAYFNRGFSYSKKEEFDKSILDFTTVIRLDPENKDAYFNRGLLYQEKEDFYKSILDFTTVIELDDTNINAYYCRGIVFEKNKEFDKAIEDYHKVIELKDAFKDSYYRLGCCYELKEKSSKKWYNKWIEQLVEENKDIIDFLPAIGSNQIEKIVNIFLDEKKKGDKNCGFYKLIGNSNEQALKYSDTYRNIYICIWQIFHKLMMKEEDLKKPYAHYTTKETIAKLFIEKSKLRLYSILTANDSKEGSTLFDFLEIKENSDNVSATDKQAFIGCFSSEVDNLNLFRLYGKENTEEGSGISITLNSNFFSTDGISDIFPKASMIEEKDSPQKEEEKEEEKKYPLFRCIYLNPRLPLEEQQKYLSDLGIYDLFSRLKELINDRKKKKESKTKEEIDVIICNLLLPIQFLVKDVAFKEEKEYRMICVKDIYEDGKKAKDDREIKYNDDYSRMYIEYKKITNDCIDGMTFGPKVKNHRIFTEILKHNQVRCNFKKSELPLS